MNCAIDLPSQPSNSYALEGTLTEITYFDKESQWGIFRVLSENQDVYVTANVAKPVLFEQWRIRGAVRSTPLLQREIEAESIIASPPKEESFIRQYLIAVTGQSPKHCAQAVDLLGTEVLQALDAAPKRLIDCGMEPAVVEVMHEKWLEARGFDAFCNSLEIFGIDESAVSAVLNRYSDTDQARMALRNDPYLIYRCSELVSYKQARQIAQHYEVSPSGASAARGAIVAALRMSLSRRGIKSLTPTDIWQSINSGQLMGTHTLTPAELYDRLRELVEEGTLCEAGNSFMMNSISFGLKRVGSAIKSRLANPGQPEIINLGVPGGMTICPLPDISCLTLWLEAHDRDFIKLGVDITVVSGSRGSVSKLESQSSYVSVGYYLDMCQFYSEGHSNKRAGHVLPGDLIIIVDCHLIPDADLAEIIESAPPESAVSLAVFPETVQAGSYNNTPSLLQHLPEIPSWSIPATGHEWQTSDSPVGAEGTWNPEDPIGWVDTDDEHIYPVTSELYQFLKDDADYVPADIAIVYARQFIGSLSVPTALRNALGWPHDAPIDVGDSVIATTDDYLKGVRKYSRWLVVAKDSGPALTCPFSGREIELEGGIHKHPLQKADFLPMELAHGLQTKVILMICPESHAHLLSRQALVSLSRAAQDHLIIIGPKQAVLPHWSTKGSANDAGTIHRLSEEICDPT